MRPNEFRHHYIIMFLWYFKKKKKNGITGQTLVNGMSKKKSNKRDYYSEKKGEPKHSGSSRKVLLSIFVYKACLGKLKIHVFDITLAHKSLILSMIYHIIIVDIGTLIFFKKL